MKLESKVEEYTVTLTKEEIDIIWHSVYRYNKKWEALDDDQKPAREKIEQALWELLK